MIGESSADSHAVCTDIKADVMVIDRDQCAVNNAAETPLDAVLDLEADRAADVRVEIAIRRTGIDDSFEPLRRRRMRGRIIDFDRKDRYPDGRFVRERWMRLSERKDLVVEAHRRLQKNSGRPVLWDPEDEWICFAIPFGGDRRFLECVALGDDVALVRRKGNPAIQ